MKKSYIIEGMTCKGCVKKIKKNISEIPNINEVSINLENSSLEIDFKEKVSFLKLQESIPKKYKIIQESNDSNQSRINSNKLLKLKPLFLIFLYIFGISFFINIRSWNINEFMFDYMGLFFIFFSFFKLLDLNGFISSFRLYDPIAIKISFYSKIYPFLELFLGIMFLLRLNVEPILYITIFILSTTTLGVLNALYRKKEIQCGCLGTVFQLPMTEVTLIENFIMIFMSIFMIISLL